jgi:hypothetical protein
MRLPPSFAKVRNATFRGGKQSFRRRRPRGFSYARSCTSCAESRASCADRALARRLQPVSDNFLVRLDRQKERSYRRRSQQGDHHDRKRITETVGRRRTMHRAVAVPYCPLRNLSSSPPNRARGCSTRSERRWKPKSRQEVDRSTHLLQSGSAQLCPPRRRNWRSFGRHLLARAPIASSRAPVLDDHVTVAAIAQGVRIPKPGCF